MKLYVHVFFYGNGKAIIFQRCCQPKQLSVDISVNLLKKKITANLGFYCSLHQKGHSEFLKQVGSYSNYITSIHKRGNIYGTHTKHFRLLRIRRKVACRLIYEITIPVCEYLQNGRRYEEMAFLP